MTRSFTIILCLSCFIIPNLFAQKIPLSFDQIFRGGSSNLTQPLPRIVRWIDEDHYLEYRRDAQGGGVQVLSVEARSGKAVSFTDAEQDPPEVYFRDGDLFYKKGDAEDRQLTRTEGNEMNPTLSPDGKWAAFTRKNNLFVIEIATAKEIQITHDGTDKIMNGYASWVYYEEILGRASHYRAFWWSPDSKHLCFMRFNDTQVPVFPIYFADGQHGFLENQAYPKAGDRNPTVRWGITSVDDPRVTWCDFNENDDQYFGAPLWTREGGLWISWMPRSQDNLKVFSIDIKSGAKKELYDEKQKTWIDLDQTDRITFLPTQKSFIVKTDKSGWSNLLLYDLSGKLLNPVAEGNFTVLGIECIDEKAKIVYFTARKENSARVDYYKVALNGKGLTRLSFGEFYHRVNPSPGGKYFITEYSNLTTPTRMALVDNNGKVVRELGDSRGRNFDRYLLPKTELVRVKSSDGLFDLPMTITYPLDFDSAKKYPVLVSVYGGPNAGTVYDNWKSPLSISSWWAKEGIIQVAMDNRSSGHFGKAGMNYIYRQMGRYEIEDFMQCARWLKSRGFVDSGKICITGGSFGGYITCMALTYGAAEFNFGIANSSVIDWKLYDTHYTERYMDKPEENPEGYEKTAVLTYLDRYKGLLRIVHGTTDDNVHLQNTLQLIDKLENNRKHFEMMLYPNERHGIGSNVPAKGALNRTEAYRFIYTNLLNRPMPVELGQ